MLPSREDVAHTYTESAAFEHAGRLYRELITVTTPQQAAKITAKIEGLVFRPACELQLAGLCLLGGRDFPKPQAVVLSLACFTIDHLLWGWNAATLAQPRIASTLSRAAVEAAIFGLAANENYRAFEKAWTTRKGTGGALLHSLKNVPPRVLVPLQELWKFVVPLGHASVIPVMSARGTFLDGTGQGTGISFAGQYAGPFDATLLENLAKLFSLASVAAVETMKITLQPMFAESGRWDTGYRELRSTLDAREPVSAHLEPHMDWILEYRRRKGENSG